MVKGRVHASGIKSKTVAVVNAEWAYIYTGYMGAGCLSLNLHHQREYAPSIHGQTT